jgi:c-di-GMP-binding flagellar brake protein YcgR
MDSKPATSKDRREFYRVSCSAAIEIEELTHEAQALADIYTLPAESIMINEFRIMSAESNSLLKTLADRDSSLGAYLKVLNKKIDLLAATITSGAENKSAQAAQEIDISEGGIHFCWPKTFKKNQRLALRLTLLPDNLSFVLAAVVRSSQKQQASAELAAHFLVNVEFENIDTTSHQLIARFIAQQQRRMINQPKNKH